MRGGICICGREYSDVRGAQACAGTGVQYGHVAMGRTWGLTQTALGREDAAPSKLGIRVRMFCADCDAEALLQATAQLQIHAKMSADLHRGNSFTSFNLNPKCLWISLPWKPARAVYVTHLALA